MENKSKLFSTMFGHKNKKTYAQEYKIRVIPTQVFLDEYGKEFHRHEGFYPEEEIDKLLKSKGLKAKNYK